MKNCIKIGWKIRNLKFLNLAFVDPCPDIFTLLELMALLVIFFHFVDRFSLYLTISEINSSERVQQKLKPKIWTLFIFQQKEAKWGLNFTIMENIQIRNLKFLNLAFVDPCPDIFTLLELMALLVIFFHFLHNIQVEVWCMDLVL
jgi:hypothetical protein